MTVKDLKEMLLQVLENLSSEEEQQQVKIYNNTYWINSNFFIATKEGFINLEDPINNGEEEDY